ncbi:hypothetical protein [Paenibacillus tarimensis]
MKGVMQYENEHSTAVNGYSGGEARQVITVEEPGVWIPLPQ